MQTIINVQQLSKSYDDLSAIDNISLSVKQGTVYGLLGANGAGKSTTIECILGTKNADSGSISVLGYNPKKTDIACSKISAFNFKRVIISRKLKFQSYVKKLPACINPPLAGKIFVSNSE